MQVFSFDLLAYPEHMDHLKVNGELPYPLPKRHFRPDLAVQNYREHLDAWVLMEELGFDGIGFNEHHTSPYGLMTSPNLIAAAHAAHEAPALRESVAHPQSAPTGRRVVHAGLSQQWAPHLGLRARHPP